MQPYAGFWIRVVAYIIDAIVVNIGAGAIGLIFGTGLGFTSVLTGGSPEAAAAASGLMGGAIGLVLSWLYFAILESSSWQGTVGKKALSLVVTDMDGNRIGFGRATGRYFAKILSALILLVGFMMVGWTRQKQGLHDMICGTLVWKANAPELVRSDASVFS